MKKLYILRHGETELNRQNRLQGQIDEPLNENGIRQARALRETIGGLAFDKIYSSPLVRAVETAVYAAGADKNDIIADPRIIEIGYGSYEAADFLELKSEIIDFFMHPETVPAPEGIEPIEALMRRTGEFLDEIKNADGEAALAVTHGVAMRALFGHIIKDGRGAVWGMDIENCRVYEIDLENGGIKLLSN